MLSFFKTFNLIINSLATIGFILFFHYIFFGEGGGGGRRRCFKRIFARHFVRSHKAGNGIEILGYVKRVLK